MFLCNIQNTVSEWSASGPYEPNGDEFETVAPDTGSNNQLWTPTDLTNISGEITLG